MDEKHANESEPSGQAQASEYGDALSDVLKDQARRDELRSAPPQKVARTRVHPSIPPFLAVISIWLWVLPPSALQPVVPTIPPAQQEAGLRMEMFIQVNNIKRYVAEHGRLPNDLTDVGESAEGIRYLQLTDNVFRLSGQSGDIEVVFTSSEPEASLLADANAIVSGRVSSTPRGAGTS